MKSLQQIFGLTVCLFALSQLMAYGQHTTHVAPEGDVWSEDHPRSVDEPLDSESPEGILRFQEPSDDSVGSDLVYSESEERLHLRGGNFVKDVIMGTHGRFLTAEPAACRKNCEQHASEKTKRNPTGWDPVKGEPFGCPVFVLVENKCSGEIEAFEPVPVGALGPLELVAKGICDACELEPPNRGTGASVTWGQEKGFTFCFSLTGAVEWQTPPVVGPTWKVEAGVQFCWDTKKTESRTLDPTCEARTKVEASVLRQKQKYKLVVKKKYFRSKRQEWNSHDCNSNWDKDGRVERTFPKNLIFDCDEATETKYDNGYTYYFKYKSLPCPGDTNPPTKSSSSPISSPQTVEPMHADGRFPTLIVPVCPPCPSKAPLTSYPTTKPTRWDSRSTPPTLNPTDRPDSRSTPPALNTTFNPDSRSTPPTLNPTYDPGSRSTPPAQYLTDKPDSRSSPPALKPFYELDSRSTPPALRPTKEPDSRSTPPALNPTHMPSVESQHPTFTQRPTFKVTGDLTDDEG